MTSPPPRRGHRRGNGEGTITRRSDGRYAAAVFVVRPDGTRGRKWIYGPTRVEVARKLAEMVQRVNAGIVMPTRSPTVGEYLDHWMTEVVTPHLRPTTAAKYRTAIELYLRPALGKEKLDRLTVAGVQRFLNTRRAAGDSVQKLRWIREVLSSALGRAQREELVMRNVAQLASLPTEQRRRRLAWTAQQARQFLDAACGDAAHPVFVLAIVYGLRRGEIAALHWSDIDTEHGMINVQSSLARAGGQLVLGPTKSQAGQRTLPIVELAQTALDGQRVRQEQQRAVAGDGWADAGFVFTTRTGRPIDPHNLSRSFDRIVKASGLPPIVFHDLRRTAATLLKDLGVPARDAQVILGHSHVSVTLGIYSEVFDTQINTALQHMNRALRGPSPGR